MLYLGSVRVVPMAEEHGKNTEGMEVDVPKGWKWLLATGRLTLTPWKCRGKGMSVGVTVIRCIGKSHW